jgi:cold shock CspA family protein
LTGVVVAFDDDKGFGTIKTAEGREIFFHCTQIAGGVRTIDAGAPVAFEVVPGHLGRYEAVNVALRRASS